MRWRLKHGVRVAERPVISYIRGPAERTADNMRTGERVKPLIRPLPDHVTGFESSFVSRVCFWRNYIFFQDAFKINCFLLA